MLLFDTYCFEIEMPRDPDSARGFHQTNKLCQIDQKKKNHHHFGKTIP